jgi:predicted TPR repeat methyltransferase
MTTHPLLGPDEISVLRERLLIAPQDVGAMRDLAALLEAAGDLPGAIDLCQRALRVDPYETSIMLRLAGLWSALADLDRARFWFNRILAIDPDCTEAARLLAALEDSRSLTPAYIRTLFDQYAERFDTELTQVLHYKAPQLVAETLRRCLPEDGTADVLDLGCGTGLSGVALRPFARWLDGVDLSSRMIEQARARGIYDALAVDDAETFLMAANCNWNVVAAVDVLNYLGDLTVLFRLAAAKLARGGILAGTVEKAAAGVVLTEKRRYTHGADHLAAAIEGAGLSMRVTTEAVLRTEAGAAVTGLIFAASGS